MRTRKKGFTLIELMIVVAIIAIIAAIAYPSYQEYVRKTRFAAAKEAVMRVSSSLERGASQANTYATTAVAANYYPSEYANDLAFSYAPDTGNRAYKLSATEKTERFKIWVGINSLGTKCGCSGSTCNTAPTFESNTAQCPSETNAF